MAVWPLCGVRCFAYNDRQARRCTKVGITERLASERRNYRLERYRPAARPSRSPGNVRRQHLVLNVLVSQMVLNHAGVMPIVGKRSLERGSYQRKVVRSALKERSVVSQHVIYSQCSPRVKRRYYSIPCTTSRRSPLRPSHFCFLVRCHRKSRRAGNRCRLPDAYRRHAACCQ